MTVRHNTFMGHILKRQDESQGLHLFKNVSMSVGMLQYELCLPVRRGSKLTMLYLRFFKLLMGSSVIYKMIRFDEGKLG